MVDKICANCRFWSTEPAWDCRDPKSEDWIWNAAHPCLNPALKCASGHPASPNCEGVPATMPDFGCNQWEAIGSQSLSDSELDAALEATKARGPLTKDEVRAQKISWVAGEIGLQYPDMSPEECRRRAEAAVDG